MSNLVFKSGISTPNVDCDYVDCDYVDCDYVDCDYVAFNSTTLSVPRTNCLVYATSETQQTNHKLDGDVLTIGHLLKCTIKLLDADGDVRATGNIISTTETIAKE